jgi:hypothetical protein
MMTRTPDGLETAEEEREKLEVWALECATGELSRYVGLGIDCPQCRTSSLVQAGQKRDISTHWAEYKAISPPKVLGPVAADGDTDLFANIRASQ